MKTLHLNLASRPFRDYRPVYAVVVVGWLVIAVMGLNNFDTYYRYKRDTRTTRDETARLEAEIQQERKLANAATDRIKGIDLVSLGRQTRFINGQLAERAFSWSELLGLLEAVIPGDVRIISISPSFTDSGLVHLSLQCEAKSARGMIATITNFQDNRHFTGPFPSNQDNNNGAYRFALSVDYRPSIPRVVTK